MNGYDENGWVVKVHLHVFDPSDYADAKHCKVPSMVKVSINDQDVSRLHSGGAHMNFGVDVTALMKVGDNKVVLESSQCICVRPFYRFLIDG